VAGVESLRFDITWVKQGERLNVIWHIDNYTAELHCYFANLPGFSMVLGHKISEDSASYYLLVVRSFAAKSLGLTYDSDLTWPMQVSWVTAMNVVRASGRSAQPSPARPTLPT
jgi:hypothetical protein